MIENLKIRGLILTIVGAISWLAIYILIPRPTYDQHVPSNVQFWVQNVSFAISMTIVIVILLLIFFIRPKFQAQFSSIILLLLPIALLYPLMRVLISLIFHPDYFLGISLEALRPGLLWTISIVLLHLYLRGVDWEEIARKKPFKSSRVYDDPFEEESGSG